jgi:3-oxoacyl-[acyl-carrier-protein] synthase II
VSAVKSVVVAYDMVTPYGWGIGSCWKGLLSGKTAIGRLDRFETKSFLTGKAAVIPGLPNGQDESLVMQMLTPLLTQASAVIPRDAFLILATTTGEIEILERYVLDGGPDASGSRLDYFLNKVRHLAHVSVPGMVVSAACASSSAAIAQAAAMICRGERDCVLVVACDSVSEFVFSGFSSLMALDNNMARPFDRDRAGLSLGEAAGFMLLMSQSRASREKRPIAGEVAGWGLTSDANHMTGPSRDGSGLALAMRKAFRSADISEDTVESVAAHGTGTVYNDSMEMKAFKMVFGTRSVPVYSIKGAIGHTMGAAGLVETIVAFESLKEKVVPPTVNLQKVDDEAKGWVSAEAGTIDNTVTVSTNSGFGGINSALVLKKSG